MMNFNTFISLGIEFELKSLKVDKNTRNVLYYLINCYFLLYKTKFKIKRLV